MSNNAKPSIFTRIIRSLLRELYSRVDRTDARIGEMERQVGELHEAIRERDGRFRSELDNRVGDSQRELLGLIEQSNNGNADRTGRLEKRADELELFRLNTEKRLNTDDITTLEIEARLRYINSALRASGLVTENEGLFNKKSYSQAGEDVIIFYALIMLGIPMEKCTYLDLGANRPIEMSNTYFFYEQGARGVLVEANCTLIPELQRKRGGDTILNKCITGHTGDKVPFNVLNLDGLSKIGSVDDILAANPEAKLLETIDLETITVGDIVDEYLGGKSPVIMNLDIEGLEKEILDSIDFDTIRPLFMIIEMIPYSTELTAGIKDNELLEYVKSKGYIEYAFTGINSIFIDEKKYTELIREKLSRKEASADAR